jgi:hypothetical protein
MFDFILSELDESIIVGLCAVIIIIISVAIGYYIRKNRAYYAISYVPVDVTIDYIQRIPIEDRIDLAVEDKHNVHNSCLKRNASHVIHKLKESDRHIYTVEQAIGDIFEMIELSPDTDLDKLDDATASLNAICAIDARYHAGNISEKELIRLIWDRIHHPVNSEVITQLKENLIDQLADCRADYSGVHCCEGRIMRLLQTLENCDCEDIVSLRPMWAYKEEISNKISLYRQKLLEKVPQKYKDLENKTDLNDDDYKLLDLFNRCLINNLSRRFEIDYLSKGLLTKNELDDLTNIYYESLYDY